MPKQIKKILFRQVGFFLGLAVIVSFSSILGAILLRQVLAAPVGQGSVIIALTDIKGAGFVTGTDSLKQIRDELNTVGGPGSWNCQNVVAIEVGFASTALCPAGFNLITGGCGFNVGQGKNSAPVISNGWLCTSNDGYQRAAAWCCQ